MSQSLVKMYLHIVYSTKHRSKVLVPEIQPDLFAYTGGICNNLECQPIKIGGYLDHIHILCLLSKKITLINFLQEIKTSSSKWIKTQGKCFSQFHWQDGYGAFSVSPNQVQIVSNYISKQNEHHKKVLFEDEYRTFLKEYNIEYNERYVWD
ncbi:MAG: IS200/IS605 family transposase [Bacteroidota bacterium]